MHLPSTEASVTCTLYRFYDKDARLLYVGITDDPLRRFGQHRYAKPWWVDVDQVKVVHYGTRDEAFDAESAAIIDELPLFNLAGNEASGPWSLHLEFILRAEPRLRAVVQQAMWPGRTLRERDLYLKDAERRVRRVLGVGRNLPSHRLAERHLDTSVLKDSLDDFLTQMEALYYAQGRREPANDYVERVLRDDATADVVMEWLRYLDQEPDDPSLRELKPGEAA